MVADRFHMNEEISSCYLDNAAAAHPRTIEISLWEAVVNLDDDVAAHSHTM